MAENQPSKERSGEVKQDDVISRIVADPSAPDVQRITGFLLGNSNRPGFWRLYLNADLNHYLEFSKDDTLHAEQFRRGQTIVWLKRGAKAQEVRSRQAPLEFLQGDLRHQFLGRVPGFPNMFAMDATCSSGCAHCTASCTYPGPGGDTLGYTCGCG